MSAVSKPGDKLAILIVSLALASLFVSFLVYEHSSGELVLGWQKRPISNVRHEIGFAFQAPFGFEWMSSHMKPSPAIVLENGNAMGPGNSMHDDIRNHGQGRYSFWHDVVYFSASDNSDPRTNQKRYEILWPRPISFFFRLAAYLCAILLSLYSFGLVAHRLLPLLGADNESVGLADKFRRFLHHEDTFCFWISRLLITALASGLFFLLYSFLYEPVGVLQQIEKLFIYLLALSLLVFIGLSVPVRMKPANVISADVAFKFMAVILIASYLFFREGICSDTNSLLSIAYCLLLAFAAGILLSRMAVKLQWNLQPLRDVAKSPMTAVIGMLLLALPSIARPVIQLWDMSGYMDSRLYDQCAHNINTGLVPQGSSFVMPLYQYFLAFTYYIFGHFFYIQQIINILLALLTVLFICLTAWNIFRDMRAVWLAGILAIYSPQLYSFVYYTQIENLYIPLICLTLYLLSCYWRSERLLHLVLLGISLGLIYNCRTQGLFYCAFMCLAPLFMKRLRPIRRISHVFTVGVVFCTMLIPWTVRNAVYMGRFSIASEQSDSALLLNDHRLPLYAEQPYLLNAFNMTALQKEYETKYPDERDRAKAIRRDFLRNTLSDPVWLAKAAFWRSLGFYGLLPPGVFDPQGPKPTDWSKNWESYISNTFYALFFISISILGILRRLQRLTIILAFAVVSNLALVIVAPMREPRYGFPSLPFHLILGLFALFASAAKESTAVDPVIPALPVRRRKCYGWIGLYFAVMTLIICRITVGQENVHRRLIEKAIVMDPNVKLAEDLPSLNSYYMWLETQQGESPHYSLGERVRLVCQITNYMLPPKSAGRLWYVPEFATDPRRETYYYGYPYFGTPHMIGTVGISYFGATSDHELREDNVVEVEGIVMSDMKNYGLDYWVKAEKIHYLKDNI